MGFLWFVDGLLMFFLIVFLMVFIHVVEKNTFLIHEGLRKRGVFFKHDLISENTSYML